MTGFNNGSSGDYLTTTKTKGYDDDDTSSCINEPYGNEETLLLTILKSLGKWKYPAPLPPVWDHELAITSKTVVYADNKKLLANPIPFHYCLINDNQFYFCSNFFDCKCAPGQEGWDPVGRLLNRRMSGGQYRRLSYRRNSNSISIAGSHSNPYDTERMGLSKEIKSQRRAVTSLAKQLRNNCDKIFDLSIPFVVDSLVLRRVSEAINLVYTNRQNLDDENPEDTEYQDLVMFLSDFCQQSPSLCVSLSTAPGGGASPSDSTDTESNSSGTGGAGSRTPTKIAASELTKVDITLFKSLQFLELRNTPPHKVTGLNSIRSKLKKLKCSRCLQSLGQILLGGATQQVTLRSTSRSGSTAASSNVTSNSSTTIFGVWPELKEIDLSFNRIGSLLLEDISIFELCPSVEILNLSRNRIVTLDDKFSRVMNNLTVLNLSYNQLTSLPPIPPNVKVLFLSHNYITTLRTTHSSYGFDTFVPLKNVEVLDLSTNLLSKEEDLLFLKELNNLQKLSLLGNPISFIENYRNVIGGYLSRYAITRKFELDKKNLSSSEVRWAIEQCKQGKFIPFIPANSLIISQASVASSSTGMMTSSTGSSNSGSMSMSTSGGGLSHLKSMTQSYDSSSSSVRSSRRKKPKIREIMTLDENDAGSSGRGYLDVSTESSSQLDRSQQGSSSSKCSSGSPTASIKSEASPLLSPTMDTRQAITAIRDRYGEEHWLLRQAGTEVDKLLNIPVRPINFDVFSRSLPPNSYSKDSGRTQTGQTSTKSSAYYNQNAANSSGSGERFTNEELLVIRKNPRYVHSPSSGEDVSLGRSGTSPGSNAAAEEVDEGPEIYSCFSGNPQQQGSGFGGEEAGQQSIFDLEAGEPLEETFDEEEEGKHFKSFRIFQNGEIFKLIVFDGYLIEVNPSEKNIVLNKWDLNCLFALEEEHCDSETESVEFRLKFDTMRKQMRERSFIMSAKDFVKFDREVSPYIEERTLEEFTEALQCTKCYAQFSRAMAGRTVKHEKGQAPREVNICPNADCACDVLVTLDSIPLPNNECLDLDDGDFRRGPMRTSTPVSARVSMSMSRSIPKGRSPRVFDFLRLLPSSLTSRRSQSANNNKGKNSFDDDATECLVPPTFDHSTKSNTPTSMDGAVATNTKSESDIEVLSNDSSSIEVLTKHCGDSGSEIDVEEAIEVAVPDCLANKTLNKTVVVMSESTSSSSCADSIVTTYERHCQLLPISQPLSSPSSVPSSTSSAFSKSASLTSTSTLTTNSFSSPVHMTIPVRYDYINFSRTDHRLQLWCEISVFKSDERLLALTKCMIISDSSSSGSFLGIVIFSSRKVYLYRIIGSEGDKPQDWLQKVNAFDLSKFIKLDVLIGRHGVGVDFSGKYFALVFRDSERTSGFLEFFMSDICGELDAPPMVRDFSQTQKVMLSPTNPISYFGILRFALCDSADKSYAVSAVLLTNKDLLLITDLSWMAGRCDRVSTTHGRMLSTLRQVESLESDGSFIRLVFELATEKVVHWELCFETDNEKSLFEQHLKSEVASLPDIPFICLSQPLES